MSDQKKSFHANLDADNSSDNTDNKDLASNLIAAAKGIVDSEAATKAAAGAGGLAGDLLAAAKGVVDSQNTARATADSNASQSGKSVGDIGGDALSAQAAAKAAADAQAAADKLRQQVQAQQEQAAQDSSSDDDFVGSGGAGSAEQLDAIRRGYAERGMADPSGLTKDDTEA
jgi:hypothetical protein